MREPPVTVVMPVRNEADFIERSLRAVLSQDYPGESLEVIVADGMSTDGTRAVVSEFRKRHANIRLIDNPEGIVSTGLNRGISESTGDIIIRVDGHCEIAPDYVRRCVDYLQNDAIDGVGGSITTVGESLVARSIALAMSSKFGVGGSAFRVLRDTTLFADTIPFPAYRRSAIDCAGPYDEELVRNQDDEYNYRLRSMGARLLLAADVRSTYHSRSSFGSLFRQYFQYGYWKVRVMQKHPKQTRPRQFVPPLFVSSLAFGLAASLVTPVGIGLLTVVVGLYALANVVVSAYAAARNGWQLFLLPIAFSILHISYGSGFLVGLVRFWNRWGERKEKARLRRDLRSRELMDSLTS